MTTPPRILPEPSAHTSRVQPTVEPLDFRRLASAKSAYTTRLVSRSRLIASDPRGYGLLTGEHVVPQAGDIVLSRTLKPGQHGGIQRRYGRRASLFGGEGSLVAYGGRYAPDGYTAFRR